MLRSRDSQAQDNNCRFIYLLKQGGSFGLFSWKSICFDQWARVLDVSGDFGGGYGFLSSGNLYWQVMNFAFDLNAPNPRQSLLRLYKEHCLQVGLEYVFAELNI